MLKALLKPFLLRLCTLVALILCAGGSAWGETATLTQSLLGLTGSYTSNTQKTIDGITYVYTDLMKNNDNIQAKATTGTIYNETAFPGDITSVAITHSGTARATTISGSADGTDWTQVATGSGTITADFSGKGFKYFKISRGDNAAYWTKIEIEYTSDLVASDLALSSSSLTFDLYNNSSAQTISYTTLSTGAVTVSGGAGYVTTSVDATAKTITVMPTAATPSAQTITVSQAADGTYAAGSATFTVTVGDSSPFSGENVTFVAGTDKGTTSSNNSPDAVTKSVVTVACTDAAFATAEYRIYKNSTLTISTTKGKITSIDFTSASGYYTNYLMLQGNNGYYDNTITDQTHQEWTGSSTSVSFKALSQVRLTYIVVTVSSADAIAPPSISGSTPFFGSTQVTITGDDGATIYYTTDGTEPSTSSTQYTAPFALSASATVKAIAAKDGKVSAVTSKAFERATSYKLNEISELAEGNYYFELDNAVVTYANGSYSYIEDANGAILYYKNGHGLTAGQVLNGFAYVTYKTYNGQPEITSLSDVEPVAGSATPQPTVATIAALFANPATYMSKFVKLENVLAAATASGFTLSQGEGAITFYGRNSAAVEADKTYDIIGFLSKHDENYQFTVHTPDHITEIGGLEKSATPVISVADGTEGAKVVTISAAEGATIYYTTDGTDPTAESTAYTAAITVTAVGNHTIKAVALEEGKVLSLVATETFTVTAPAYITLPAGYAETITNFPSFSGSGYHTLNDYKLVVNEIPYNWSVKDVMSHGTGIQLKADNGKVTSPEIRTPYGYKVSVRYTCTDNELSLTSGELSGTTIEDEFTGDKIVSLLVASPAAAFSFAANSRVCYVYGITIEALATAPEAYAVMSADKKTVTFYYDNNKSENTGDGTAYDITDGTTEYTNWAGSYANNSVKPGTITKAVFTEAFKKYDGLTSLDNWFNYCERLTEIEGIENLNTANVTTMRNMFNHCLVLTSLDLSSFNTSSVTDMYDMFSQCRALTSIDLSSFNTENVTNMSYMFSYCQALQTLDLSSFNTSNVSNMKWMFATMPELTTIYVSDLWSNAATNLNNSESMFYGCSKLVGGAGTAYSTSLHNYSYNTYAIIDGTDGKPGYFTDIAVKPVSVTIGASGYATFVAPKAVSFPGAVEAFIVTEVKESSVHLEAVSAAVPAGTPLVLRAAQGTYELPITTEAVSAVEGNLLLASDGNVTGNGSIYALGVGKEGDATGKVGFFPVTSGAKVPTGKAYLSTANGVKAFLGFDFDLPTSVDEMKNEELRMKNSEIFDLSGRRVAKAQKGVYIVNGRKVAIN